MIWMTCGFQGGYRDVTLLDGRSICLLPHTEREDDMTESVYKVIELIGTSKDSWEKAAAVAVNRAGKSLRTKSTLGKRDMITTGSNRAGSKLSFL